MVLGGPGTAGFAAKNVFVGNNLSGLDSNFGITYMFHDNTRENVVVGKTDGIDFVVKGHPSNIFTGPGFNGLGNEAAIQASRAMSSAKRAMDKGVNEWNKGWHQYYGPR